MREQFFKICPMCGKTWYTRDDFLDDHELDFNGYQADFGYVEQGLFYFTHYAPYCGSTMAFHVEAFLSLYTGPRYKKMLHSSKECEHLCDDRNQLGRCKALCEMAFAREVAQLIKERKQLNIATIDKQ